MHALSKDTDTASAPRCFSRVALGGKVRLSHGNNKTISCESIGFRNGRTPVMPRRPMVDEFANPMRGRAPQQQGAGLAQRETGLSIERPGAGDENGHGAITGRSAVLVEGAVHNEPVDHAVRNFADHYIVLERNIVERGHFPSTNKFESVRRAMPDCNTPQEQSLALTTLAPRADCEVPAEFIRFGARKAGTNGELDIVVERYPHPEVFHTTDEGAAFTECYAVLEKIMDSTPGKGDGS
jgi:flagellar biosynthesis/type III secretory pathway ATPase